jgi:hypothetical protein
VRVLRPLSYFVSLILCIGPLLLSGCGVFNQYKKNSEGYYEQHYNCCGPIAVEKAINGFYRKQGIVFVRNPAPRKEVSQKIQRNGMHFKECLAYFDPEAICITWPSEIKQVIDKYGFELITVGNLKDLDSEKDVAIVLVHGRLLSRQYHWLVFPLDNVKEYYGKDTVIDKVYLLKFKK